MFLTLNQYEHAKISAYMAFKLLILEEYSCKETSETPTKDWFNSHEVRVKIL